MTCSFLIKKGEKILSVEIVAKNITEDFEDKKQSITIFKPGKAAKLSTAGQYLFHRVMLKNITTTSTSATMTFQTLECIDEKDYMCVLFYNNIEDGISRLESGATRILVQG